MIKHFLTDSMVNGLNAFSSLTSLKERGDSLGLCFFSLVSYVGERPWWPIQCLNRGRKKKAKG